MLNFSFIEATENMCLELAHVKKQVWLTTYKGIYSDSKIEDFDYSEHEKKFKKYINSQDLKLYVAVLEKRLLVILLLASLHTERKNKLKLFYSIC